jgi:sugar lactone lactonase YvrE
MKTNTLHLSGMLAAALLPFSATLFADPVTVTSEPFDVIPAGASQFIYTVNPATTGAGMPTTFTVQTLDEFDNITNDHSGFADILEVTGASAFAAGFDPVNFPATPSGADPFEVSYSLHTFEVCFRLAGEYTLTVDAPGMEPTVHTLTVEPTILWNPVTNVQVTYMADYYQVLYAYDPDLGPVFNYSATGLPPGLSISTSFDLIDTIAGSGVADYDAADDGGLAINAAIGDPQGIAVAADGTVYMTDSWNGLVRKRAPDGTISTVFDVEATFGVFGAPFGVVMEGNALFVTDAALSRVYLLDRADTYSATVLLDGTDGLVAPFGLALDGTFLYIANTFAHQVLAYDLLTSHVSVFAGTGSAGFTGDGVAATSSGLNFPEDVAVDRDGNVYIADTDSHRIRMVDGDGIITTIAGTGVSGFSGDGGPATLAELQGSAGIGVDSSGRIVVSDTFNNRLRLVRANGDIETIAGGNIAGFAGDGGDAADSRLFGPTGIAFGPDMSIYIADTGNHRVRQVYLSVAILSGNPEDVNRDAHGNLIPYDITLNAHPGYGCGVDYLFDLDVLPKELNVINAVAASKTYDATTDAVVSGAELDGIEAPGGVADDVGLTHATVGVFAQDGVGTDIEVTTLMGLAGDHAYRYTIAQPDYLEADIFHRLVTYVVDGGQGKIYGETDDDANLTGAVDLAAGDGLVAGHLFTTGDLVRAVGEDVGNYAINQGDLAIFAGAVDVTANYDLTFVSDNFVITQRPLSIVASGAEKTYGDPDPAFPFNEPALQWDDVFVGALSREAGQNVDSYDFLIGTLSIEDGAGRNVAHNYDITFDGATHPFTITPAMLIVTANDDSKIYDALAYSGGNDVVITGFQFSEDRSALGGTLTFSGSSQGALNQGVYVITPGGYTSQNYNFTYEDGELTILRRALEITANDRSKTYGDTISLGTSAFITDGNEAGSEVVTSVVLTAEDNADSNPNAPVGGYAITPSGGTGTGGFDADNYAITYTDGTLTIGTRAITITAADHSKIYGDELIIPSTAFLLPIPTGGELSGILAPTESVDTVVLTVEDNAAVDQNANVGTYTITPSGAAGSGFDANNYDITYELGTLTINQRPLTITADNRSKLYGEALDLGTTAFSLAGMAPILAPGEEVTSVTLTSDGSAEKAPVADSPYAIHTANASGTGGFDVANYDITYSSDGTLTIDPRVITVIADNQSKTFGESHDLGTTAFTVTGQTLIDEPIENVDLASLGTALCANVEDTHPIIASSPTGSAFEPSNYDISFTDGLLTVNQADQEILYTDILEPVEWKSTLTLQATRFSESGCDAPADIEFAATLPGLVAAAELTFNMRGPVTVTASLDGDANYKAAADVTQDILVRAEPIWESTPVTSGTVSVDYSYELAVSDLDGWRWDLSLVAVDPATPDWLSIRHVPDERRIHLFAGTGVAGTADGAAVTGPNFPAKSAEFDRPYGLAITADMTVYVADRDNHVVRRIHPWGSVEVVAGTMDVSGFAGDGGAATDARLAGPRDIALSPDESLLYIADTGNHRVRKVDLSTGIITTVAGSGGSFGQPGENVDATATQLGSPYAVVATADKLYIASVGLHRIRVVDLNASTISTLVGSGAGNPLNQPTGLFLDGDDLYIADRGRHRIALFDLNTGSLTTIAGTTGTSGFTGDGGDATEALLNQPHAVTVADGVLYITDSNNHRIRTVDLSDGTISTLSGASTNAYFGDNIHVGDALLNGPRGIVSDGHGHIFFADMNNHRIRRIDNGTFYLEGIPYQAGEYEVTLHADDSWFATEQVFTITVEPFIPVIDAWAVAANITYGDLLGSSALTDGLALDGQGDVLPGVFSWDDEEILLPHGTHTPSVTFTPNDDVNYESVTSNAVSVFVEKRDLFVTAVADRDSIVYGEDAPLVSVEYAGFITGEDENDLIDTGFALDTNYVAGDPIGTYNTTIAMGSADAANYAFVLETSTFEVTRRELIVTYTAQSRTYDGTTNVVVTTSDNRFGTDDLTVNFTAAFADKFAGEARTVNITGANLSGPDAGNYTVAGSATTTADITPRPLEITFTGVDRTYDATDVAQVDASDDRVTGDVFTILRTAIFTDGKDVGIDKNIAISGVSLTGADASNYEIDSFNATTAATISKAELTVSGAIAQNKVYNNTVDASITGASLVGILLSDAVSLVEPMVGEFAQATVGNGIAVTPMLEIEGADAHNYDLVQPIGLNADILQAPLTITAHDAIKTLGDTLVFNGDEFSVSGLISGSGDDVTSVTLTSAGADSSADLGQYAIVASDALGSGVGNYDIEYIDGLLSVVFDDANILYHLSGLDDTLRSSATSEWIILGETFRMVGDDIVPGEARFLSVDPDVFVVKNLSDAEGARAGDFTDVPTAEMGADTVVISDFTGHNRIYGFTLGDTIYRGDTLRFAHVADAGELAVAIDSFAVATDLTRYGEVFLDKTYLSLRLNFADGGSLELVDVIATDALQGAGLGLLGLADEGAYGAAQSDPALVAAVLAQLADDIVYAPSLYAALPGLDDRVIPTTGDNLVVLGAAYTVEGPSFVPVGADAPVADGDAFVLKNLSDAQGARAADFIDPPTNEFGADEVVINSLAARTQVHGFTLGSDDREGDILRFAQLSDAAALAGEIVSVQTALDLSRYDELFYHSNQFVSMRIHFADGGMLELVDLISKFSLPPEAAGLLALAGEGGYGAHLEDSGVIGGIVALIAENLRFAPAILDGLAAVDDIVFSTSAADEVIVLGQAYRAMADGTFVPAASADLAADASVFVLKNLSDSTGLRAGDFDPAPSAVFGADEVVIDDLSVEKRIYGLTLGDTVRRADVVRFAGLADADALKAQITSLQVGTALTAYESVFAGKAFLSVRLHFANGGHLELIDLISTDALAGAAAGLAFIAQAGGYGEHQDDPGFIGLLVDELAANLAFAPTVIEADIGLNDVVVATTGDDVIILGQATGDVVTDASAYVIKNLSDPGAIGSAEFGNDTVEVALGSGLGTTRIYGFTLGEDAGRGDVLSFTNLADFPALEALITSVQFGRDVTPYGESFVNKAFLSLRLNLGEGRIELVDLIGLDAIPEFLLASWPIGQGGYGDLTDLPQTAVPLILDNLRFVIAGVNEAVTVAEMEAGIYALAAVYAPLADLLADYESLLPDRPTALKEDLLANRPIGGWEDAELFTAEFQLLLNYRLAAQAAVAKANSGDLTEADLAPGGALYDVAQALAALGGWSVSGEVVDGSEVLGALAHVNNLPQLGKDMILAAMNDPSFISFGQLLDAALDVVGPVINVTQSAALATTVHFFDLATALAVAQPGDRIEVDSGNFRETVLIENLAGLTLTAVAPDVFIEAPDGMAGALVAIIDSADVTLEGFHFDGRNEADTAIAVQGSDDVTVVYSRFSGVPVGIENVDALAVNAVRNFWGESDLTGPMGAGAAVSGDVLFDPWYDGVDLENLVLVLDDFAVADKVYDGTVAIDPADVSFSDNRTSGDALTFTFNAEYLVRDVGTYTVDITNIAIDAPQDPTNTDTYVLLTTAGSAESRITPRDLTLSNFVAHGKTYDGSRSVLSGDAFDDDRVSGDDLEFAYTVLFDTRDAGTNKDVAFSDITISGGLHANNYTLVTLSGTATADITPLGLTIGGSFTADSKTYDRTRSVDTDVTGLTLETPVAGDDVSLTAVQAAFVSAAAGSPVTVEITAADLTGVHAPNYTLSILDAPTAEADIWPKILTVVGLTGDNREFDGTTDATASGTAGLDGIISPDEVILAGTPVFTFADPNVANGIEITTTGFTLVGAQSGNYDVIQPVLSADILPLPVAITPVAGQSKIAGDADPVFTYTADPSLIGGDAFTGALSRVDAGGNTAGQFAYELGSLDAGINYALSLAGSETFTVNPNVPFALTIDQIDPDTGDVVSPAIGIAGESISIRISAVDAYGNVAPSYNGLRRLRLSGPQVSNLGDIPVYTEDIVDGIRQTVEFDATNAAICEFINGVFETEMDLFMAEDVIISGFSTANNNDFINGVGFYTGTIPGSEPGYPLAIQVVPAAADYLAWEVEPQEAPTALDPFTVIFDAVWDDFAVGIYDAFGNFRDTDTSEISLAVTDQAEASAKGSFANVSPLTVNALEGIATFSGLIYRDPAALATLTFVAESAGMSSTDASEPVEVLPAAVDFTIALYQTRAYNGAEFVPEVTVDPDVSFSITYFAGADADVGSSTPLAGAPVDVGAYTFVVEITDPRYEGSATAHMSISPVTLTVAADDQSKTYDGATFSAFTYEVTGFVNDEDETVISGDVTFTGAAVSAINAGTHTITPVVTGLSATNYVFESADGSLTINQAEAIIETFPVVVEYDGQAVAGNVIATGVEAVPTDLSGLLTIGTINTVAQSGTVAWSFAGNQNYLSASGTAAVTITRRELSIEGSFTAGNKVYDLSTVATITDSSGLSLTPVVTGDDVFLINLEADFASAEAGTHVVALTAADLDGDDANNYTVTLAGSPTTEATILRGTLTIAGSFTAAEKVYDGSADAELISESLILNGALGSDEVELDTVTLAFADSQVADGKTVSIVAVTLSGAEAANYEVDLSDMGTPTAIADITAKPLFVIGTFTAQNKRYDRTTAADFLSNDLSIDSADVVGSDDVSLGAVTLAFADANVDEGIDVFITAALLQGDDAGNYTIDLTDSPTTTANITQATLTVDGSFTAADKTYDGNTAATMVENNLALVGILLEPGDLDDVSIADVTIAFADDTVAGSPHTVSITDLVLGGAQAGNYLVDLDGAPTAEASITALELTIGGTLAADDKDYDQTNTVDLDVTGLTLVTPVGGDSVALANVVGAFASAAAGGDVAVSITSADLSGPDAGNYSLNLAGAPTTTATIRTIALTLSNFVADSKTYDGSTAVTGAAFDDNRLSGDEIAFTFDAAFADKNAGDEKDVNFTNIVISGGAHAGNYSLATTEGTATADISARDLLLSAFQADGRVYDATTDVPAGHGFDDDRLGTDELEFSYDIAFDSKNVGTRTANFTNIAISGGADADNYVLQTTSGSATAEITPADLTLTVFTAPGKVYDATTDVPAGHGFADDRIGTDDLEFSYDVAFDSKNVGTRTANFTNIAISGGADADNYALQTTSGSSTAEITAAPLSVINAVAENKVYDGTDVATVTGAKLDGVLGDDVVTIASISATFDDKEVGSDKPVTAVVSITGADAGNYDLTQPTGLTADIVPDVLGSFTVTGIASPRNAGVPASVVVTAFDTHGNVKIDYEGTITFSSSDSAADLPADYTFTLADAGVATIPGVVLKTVDTHWVRVTDPDGGEDGEQPGIVVNPAGVHHLTIAGEDTQVAGEAQTITVSARDAFGNLVPSYDGVRLIVFSGANPSTDVAEEPHLLFPEGEKAPFGDSTLATFVAGEWSIEMVLFRAETALISAFASLSPTGTGFSADGYELEVEVVAAEPAKLLWEFQPAASVAVGETWEPFSLLVADFWGNVNTEDAVEVTLVPSMGSFVGGNTTVTSVNGDVIFDDLVFGTAGVLTVEATAAGLQASGASDAVTVGTVELTIDGILVAENKAYDGNTDATIDPSAVSLVGLAPGADVQISTVGTFASADVADGIAVTVALTGPDAASYTLVQPVGLTADITPKQLTIGGEFTAEDKLADGSVEAVMGVNQLELDGLVGLPGEEVMLMVEALAFDSAAPGVDIPVSITSASLYGASAGNYTVTTDGAPVASATITAPFTAFLGENFGEAELADPAISGPMADADGDGWPNIFEFFFDSNPTVTDTQDPIASEVVDGTTFWNLERRANTTGVTVRYEVSSSPVGPWTVLPPENINETPNGTDRIAVTIQDIETVTPGAPRFFRILLELDE